MGHMYKYKNIILFWNNGWHADYSDNGKRFALHRCCCRTKKSAYVIAKGEVDYMKKGERKSVKSSSTNGSLTRQIRTTPEQSREEWESLRFSRLQRETAVSVM
jgi:hypothetical protein